MLHLSRAELRERFRELRDLINAWDPIGVLDDPDWPRDEYEGLVGPVLRRLEAGDTPAQLAAYLRAEARDRFGLDPDGCPPEAAAARMVAWYRTRWPGTGPVPHAG
jgi:hypothetical protein